MHLNGSITLYGVIYYNHGTHEQIHNLHNIIAMHPTFLSFLSTYSLEYMYV